MSFIIENNTGVNVDLGRLSPTYIEPQQEIDLTKYNTFTDILDSYIFLKNLESNNQITFKTFSFNEASMLATISVDNENEISEMFAYPNQGKFINNLKIG